MGAAARLATDVDFSGSIIPPEFRLRLRFIFGALVVARIGTYIPVPGFNQHALADIFKHHASDVFGMFNILSGGSFFRMSVLALGIMPYLLASAFLQLMIIASPFSAALTTEGKLGKRKISQYTRYVTVLLALLQGFGIAMGLEHMHGSVGNSAVLDPGMFYRLTTAMTLMGGTMFLVWLGEQISARGFGNGASLIIFSGIVAGFPSAVEKVLQLARMGSLSTELVLYIFLGSITLSAFVVFIERARRRIMVTYPKRQVGQTIIGGVSSRLLLKVNESGVTPPIVASSVLLFPLAIAGFSEGNESSLTMKAIAHLYHSQPLYTWLYMATIVFFSFFYSSKVFNAKDTAGNLMKYGGFIGGIEPGEKTAEYLDYVLTRLTAIEAIYLAFVCAIPDVLISKYNLPFYLSGTSIFITVNVLLNFIQRLHSQLIRERQM